MNTTLWLLFTALFSATPALATGEAGKQQVRSTYQQERATCMEGRSQQDRATCMREVNAARAEAAKGKLAGANPESEAEFDRNRLARCERQPVADRADCIRRMNGEGTTRGSVESGGIYRELVTPITPTRP